jgi:hypothetical protein
LLNNKQFCNNLRDGTESHTGFSFAGLCNRLQEVRIEIPCTQRPLIGEEHSMYINIIPASRRELAIEAFRRLNLKARLSRLFSGNGALLDFNEIDPPLNPMRTLRGLQDIPVARIVGSLGRARDFDRDFRPLKKHLRDRWIRNYLDLQTDSWAPIRVHQVGRDYFVEDGHHRITAYLWRTMQAWRSSRPRCGNTPGRARPPRSRSCRGCGSNRSCGPLWLAAHAIPSRCDNATVEDPTKKPPQLPLRRFL